MEKQINEIELLWEKIEVISDMWKSWSEKILCSFTRESIDFLWEEIKKAIIWAAFKSQLLDTQNCYVIRKGFTWKLIYSQVDGQDVYILTLAIKISNKDSNLNKETEEKISNAIMDTFKIKHSKILGSLYINDNYLSYAWIRY